MNDKDTDVVDLLKYLKLPEFSARKIGALKEHDSGSWQPTYRVAPDTDLAGYPANIFAGYPVSG